MINPQDEIGLRKLYTEMNIGFMAPQNGGIATSSISIIKQAGDITPDTDNKDVGQILTSVIDELNHLKIDIDQGVRGDVHISKLQQCSDSLSQAIEQLGNTSSQQYQSGAFTGALNNSKSQSVSDGDATNMMKM